MGREGQMCAPVTPMLTVLDGKQAKNQCRYIIKLDNLISFHMRTENRQPNGNRHQRILCAFCCNKDHFDDAGRSVAHWLFLNLQTCDWDSRKCNPFSSPCILNSSVIDTKAAWN
ncbi:hypothetical protein M514_06400 [Trichuris suis]|uniref:Uncharacterized protein n=1 Tax=Trichuris suis TaxID=68888 RepID=A0A085M698_9BILA|nr:hypothetical protein M513_06400 [Trichuris suis]KFD71531.1 hypothetical protein M514_06400 [Trichuris suis]